MISDERVNRLAVLYERAAVAISDSTAARQAGQTAEALRELLTRRQGEPQTVLADGSRETMIYATFGDALERVTEHGPGHYRLLLERLPDPMNPTTHEEQTLDLADSPRWAFSVQALAVLRAYAAGDLLTIEEARQSQDHNPLAVTRPTPELHESIERDWQRQQKRKEAAEPPPDFAQMRSLFRDYLKFLAPANLLHVIEPLIDAVERLYQERAPRG